MLKPGGSIPLDAPSLIHRKVDQRRIEFNRNARSMDEEMDLFMEDEARRWQPVKRPTWMNRFRKVLLRGRTSKFGSFVRQMFQ